MSHTTGAVGRSPVIRIAADIGSSGAARLREAAREAAGSLPVVGTGPTGVTSVEPLVLATTTDRTAFFADPSPDAVRGIVSELEAGSLPEERAFATVEHGLESEPLPRPESGPLSVGTRDVLGPCGWVDPLDPDERTLSSERTDAEPVADTGLRGRGRGDAAADDPVAATWHRAREAAGDPVVVVNANEPSGRVRPDRLLLAGDPMSVLDGVAAVADYVDADDAVIYLNEDESDLQRRVRSAVEAAGSALSVTPELVAGPNEHRAGSPTAALEALEGADRIEPRLQPPPPAEHGLYGRPTVVHTPRTFAHVSHVLGDPGAVDPEATDPGTRLLTVRGDVSAPATVELGPNASLGAVLDAVEMDGSFKMACVGGVLGGITRSLDVAPSAHARAAAGLGTDGAVELLNERRCAVADAGDRATFAASENSGRCVPGREGTKQLAELLREVYDGSFKPEKIRELGRVMRRSSNCATGAHAPRPVTTAIDEFEPEFKAHAAGRCPSGTCTEVR